MDALLIVDEPASGAWNMAVDEALLRWASESGKTVLRFYQWSEPTLSLGYFQRYGDRHAHRSSATIPAVRRTTGGGAIVHDQELTYSFVTPIRDRFHNSLQTLVSRFHESLIACLRNRGILADLIRHTSLPDGEEAFLCFQRRSKSDVVIDRQKIAGSAQRRHRGALLQHGSVLWATSTAAPELPGISDLKATSFAQSDLMQSWLEHLAAELDVQFIDSELPAPQRAWALDFEQNRFASRTWTQKR